MSRVVYATHIASAKRETGSSLNTVVSHIVIIEKGKHLGVKNLYVNQVVSK